MKLPLFLILIAIVGAFAAKELMLDAATKSKAGNYVIREQSAITPRTAVSSTVSQAELVDWFRQYDSIRREAQMTMPEKMKATQLMSAAARGDVSDADEAAVLLGRLATKYGKASQSLKSLPAPAQTKELKDLYVRYFSTGHAFFSKYRSTLAAKDQDAMLNQLRHGRSQMSLLDSSAKRVDRQLREKYKIEPFRA